MPELPSQISHTLTMVTDIILYRLGQASATYAELHHDIHDKATPEIKQAIGILSHVKPDEMQQQAYQRTLGEEVLIPLIRSLQLPVSYYEKSEKKEPHLAAMVQAMQRWYDKYDIGFARGNETKALQNYYLPLVKAINADNKLLDIFRRKHAGAELQSGEQEQLVKYEYEYAMFRKLSFVLANDRIYGPAAVINSFLEDSVMHYHDGLNAQRQDDPLASLSFARAAGGLCENLKALEFIQKQMAEASERPVPISEAMVAQLEEFGNGLDVAMGRWRNSYYGKLGNSMHKAHENAVGRCNTLIDKAKVKSMNMIHALQPKPVGVDDYAPMLLQQFRDGVSGLKKQLAMGVTQLATTSPEFTAVYEPLLGLHERMDFVREGAQEVMAMVAQSSLASSDFGRQMHEYAKTVCDGFGDLSQPNTPQTQRNRAAAMLALVEQPLDVIDKASATYHRLQPLVQTLLAYALQHCEMQPGTQVEEVAPQPKEPVLKRA